ncbi:MAG: class I SAM-dependent methyltransferase [Candidatus Viridilinea halotolerans]|uniref:Class I SAM-dependent methyltransferase n=1 Tax=Candidatus Viridilinea halotolerans TaxID=2491704 RepID=A0A426U8U1_9CHLR|nr:MAG: class I SAM-dependent methyltransferase [Candidatus Viridilinea halotolerans]
MTLNNVGKPLQLEQLDLDDLYADVAASYGALFERLNRIPAQKHAQDVLNPRKVVEKLVVLERFAGDLQGQTLLEIGSGYGVFVAVTRLDYGMHSFGLEPGGAGYTSSLAVSRRLMERCSLAPQIIVEGVGEQMPFQPESFDLVYSTHVLEHVQNPRKVLHETVRVLRPGGLAQIVVPNYGSFWDGHYGMFWPPYISHRFARILVRLAGRDPAFVDTLQLITLRHMRTWMKQLQPQAEVLDWGEQLFHERMTGGRFTSWAAVGRVKRLVDLARRLGVAHAVSWVLRRCDAITPIVLTFRKR